MTIHIFQKKAIITTLFVLWAAAGCDMFSTDVTLQSRTYMCNVYKECSPATRCLG